MTEPLIAELRSLIEGARQRTAVAVYSELVWLYWQIGRRLHTEVLADGRAEYGKALVARVSANLTADFGRGFTQRNIYNMLRFATAFPDPEKVHALRARLSWTHLRELVSIDDPLKRDFYVELCRVERWSTRALRDRIDGMLYERTAIAKLPDEVIRRDLDALRDGDRMSPDLVFRDPYTLDFLGLGADFSERELEAAILRDLETFLLELGGGSTSMSAKWTRIPRWASSFAPTATTSRSSCWNSTMAASASRPT
jgi:predicted nuclease of restriction endonuclease-like (RecB) superfamily